jgi:homoserine O-acetyltransferase
MRVRLRKAAARAILGLSLSLTLGLGLFGAAAALPLDVHQGDWRIGAFTFRDGQALADLHLHYRTLGQPRRDPSGRVTNAVLLLHGTGGTGAQFLQPQFAEVLFRPGGQLDPQRYYIIMPDNVGHGLSSRPSEGLHARFPQYDYDDMVLLQHRLLAEHLGVSRLRLILGTSMGCMHGFVWGETFPNEMDAIAAFACAPTQISGRNRLWRKMAMDAIRADPAWFGGEYQHQPVEGLRAANDLLIIAGAAPHQMQAAQGTRDLADAFLAQQLPARLAASDANDVWYALNASRTYDPSGSLEKIRAPLLWINSADDFINPPELQVGERFGPRLSTTRFVLLPIGPNTHGHGTHTWAVAWESYLAELLVKTELRP